MIAKQIDKAAKRQQIYQAAMELFAQQGMVGTTIQQIADRAGVGKGTVYEYFDSKDDILVAAFQFLRSEMEKTFRTKLEGVEDPRAQLEAVFYGMAEYLDSMSDDFAEILLVFWAEGILTNPGNEPYEGFDLRAMYEQYIGLVASIVDRGKTQQLFSQSVESEDVASVMVGMMDGILLQWVLFQERVDLKELTGTMLDTLMHGLLTETSHREDERR